MAEPLAYHNGRFLLAHQLAVEIDDAGFMLGVTVSEQLRTFGGKVFRLPEHLDRLNRSLAIVGVSLPCGRAQIVAAAEQLVTKNHRLLPEGDDLGLTICVTPGSYGDIGSDRAKPNLYLHTRPLAFASWANLYHKGQSLVTTDVMQVPANCWPPELKCRSRVHYYLADQQARQQEPGARALMRDADGHILESTTANVLFLDHSGNLLTPPHEKVLPGISLSMVRDLASELGIQFIEREISVDDVAAAREALLVSTSPCILPVTRFNGQPVGDGQPGECFRALMAAWSSHVGVDIIAQADRYAKQA
jgi:branched-subunit amino acid aminotransferase/4-amino-4-deoxychorismate lyase